MQVSCGHCGMRYEFDAGEIPAEGYDAQCSSCNNVFFVAPEAPVDAPILPQVSVQVAVACPQCSALYQFESIDVPEGGYDAQCTQCDAVFLVAPHTVTPYDAAPQASEPANVEDETSFASVNELLGQADRTEVGPAPVERTEVAAHSSPPELPPEPAKPGFSPQLLDGGTFDRTDPYMRVPEVFGEHTRVSPMGIPQVSEAQAEQHTPREGREAPETPVEVTQTRVQASPYADETRNTVVSFPSEPEPPAAEPEPGATAYEPQAPQTPAPPLPQINAWTTPDEQVERLSVESTNPAIVLPGPGSNERRLSGLSAPEVDADPRAARSAPAEDPGAARRARRRRAAAEAPPAGRALRVVLLVLAVLLGGLYFVVETRPDMLTRLMQSGAQPHAVTGEAAGLFEQGKKALLRDTDTDYETAIETFGKALQQDAQYAEAQAWQVVGHSLRGADLRSEGARMYAAWEEEQAQWRGLKALERQGSALSPDQTAQSRQLEEAGPKHLQAATDTLERGGKELSVAQVQAQRARTLLPRSAPVAAAAALCYTETPNDMAVAQSLLGQYGGLAAAGADSAPGSVAAPAVDIWLLLAQGRVAATQESSREVARTAFNKALEIEPNLVRARWELAQLDVQAGRTDDAKKRYQEILAAVPDHPKSIAALAAMERPAAPGGPAATPVPSDAPIDAPDVAPPADLDAIAPADDVNAPAVNPARKRRRRRPAPGAVGVPTDTAPADAPPDAPAEPAPEDAGSETQDKRE